MHGIHFVLQQARRVDWRKDGQINRQENREKDRKTGGLWATGWQTRGIPVLFRLVRRKVSFVGARLRWRCGGGSGKFLKKKKMVQFRAFQGVFKDEFRLFFETFSWYFILWFYRWGMPYQQKVLARRIPQLPHRCLRPCRQGQTQTEKKINTNQQRRRDSNTDTHIYFYLWDRTAKKGR